MTISGTQAFALLTIWLLYVSSTASFPVTTSTSAGVEAIVNKFQHAQLARIFLTNQGRLDPDLRAALVNSGVAHLLAISAAQIEPICRGIRGINSLALSVLPRPMRHSLHLSALSHTAGFAICGLLVVLYGSTGALLRTWMFGPMYVLLCELVPQKSKLERLLTHPCIYQAIVLLFLTHTFTVNLTQDWSFLYASAGSTVCIFAQKLQTKIRHQFGRKKMNSLLKACAQILTVQFLCWLVFWPLHPISPIASLASNLICGFVLGILVVPACVLLSLCSLANLTNPLIVNPAIGIADSGLGLFTAVTTNLSELTSARDPLFLPFQSTAQVYLLCILSASFLLIKNPSARLPDDPRQ